MAEQQTLRLVHFWDKDTSAFSKIAILFAHGPGHDQDIVCNAWREICNLYFPYVAATATANHPRWAIDKEASKGFQPMTPSQLSPKPGLIVIKLMHHFSIESLPIDLPVITSRDYVWIECNAGSEDTPSGWKTALQGAAERLDVAQPKRVIHLIITIGWKCAFFLWGPISTFIGRPQLFIQPAGSRDLWKIDKRIKTVGDFPWAGNWNGVFDPDRTYSLECFWQVIENGGAVLGNHYNLAAIEQYLVTIQNSALLDLNPTMP